MSTQIDERIVEMRFDNAKFEKNVKTTMKTLDELKDKLAFKNAEKGFKNIQKSANKVSFEHLVESVDNLQSVISKRTGVMGGIFEELGAKIVNVMANAFGKIQTMINQVTFEPISTGFSEYELKVQSVQTIAANTGVLMDDIREEMYASATSITDSSEALEKAWDVFYGKYGNGVERMEALGEEYDAVQNLVNKIVAGEIKMGDAVADATGALREQAYTMDDIEYILDELNTYADKTIYNYASMTDAIGKFTVAGVDLYDSASAVQGIANLAAFVGAPASDTSRIMRELAQGLATGIINLQDWRSLENSAGFAGTVFQDHLVDMADHLYATNDAYREYIQSMHGDIGTIKELVDSYGKFRNSLTEGAWLNADVLINTLHEFAGDWGNEMYAALGYTEKEIEDIQALGQVAFEAATKSKTFTQMWEAVTEAAQSSWTESWEYIFGHFYDARNLWTDVGDELSDIVGAFNESRNAALKFWAVSPFGREKFLKGITNLWNFLKFTVSEFSEAWQRVWGTYDVTTITKWSSKFEQFTRNLSSDRAVYVVLSLAKAFEVFLDVFHATWEVIKGTARFIWNALGRLFSNIDFETVYDLLSGVEELVDQYLNLSAVWYEVLHMLEPATPVIANFIKSIDYKRVLGTASKALNVFQHSIELVGKIVIGAGVAILTVIQYILELLGIDFSFNEIDSILEMTDAFVLLADSMIILEDIPDKVRSAMDKLIHTIKMIPMMIVGAVILVNELIKEFTGIDILGTVKAVFTNIVNLFKNATVTFGEFVDKFKKAKGIGGKIRLTFAPLAEVFNNLFKGVSGFTSTIFTKIGGWLNELASGDISGAVSRTVSLLLRLFLLLQTAKSLKGLSSLSKGITGIVDVFKSGAEDAFEAMTNCFNAITSNTTVSLIFAIAAAIIALTLSLAVLASLPADRLEDAMGILLTIFGGMLTLLSSLRKAASIATPTAFGQIGLSLVGLGLGMLMLVGSMALVSLMDYDSLIKGIIVIGAIMAMLNGLIRTMDHARFSNNLIQLGVAINMIAFALSGIIMSMVALAIVLDIASFNPNFINSFGIAMGAIVIVIGIIIGLIAVMNRVSIPATTGKKMIATGIAINLITNALFGIISSFIILAGAITILTKDENYQQALIVSLGVWVSMFFLLIGLVGGLMVAASAMPSAGGAVAAKMLATAVAVNLIVSALYTMITALELIALICSKNQNIVTGGFDAPMVVLGLMVVFLASLTMVAGSVNPVNVISTAIAVNLIVGALFTMVAALLILSTVNFDNEHINKILWIMGGLIIALGLITTIVAVLVKTSSITNVFAPRISGGVSKIGTLIAGVGFAILATIASLWILIDAISKLIDLADKWDKENGKNKIVKVITDFCEAFNESEAALKSSQHHFNDLIMDFLYMLVEDILELVYMLVDTLVLGVGYILRGAVDIIIEALNDLVGTDLLTYADVLGTERFSEEYIEKFIEDLEGSPLQKLIDAIVGFIAMFIYALGNSIIKFAGPLAQAATYLIKSIIVLIVYVVGYILGYIVELSGLIYNALAEQFGTEKVDWSGFADWFVGNFDEVWNNEVMPFWSNIINRVSAWLWYGLSSTLLMITDGISGLWNGIANFINSIAGKEVFSTWDTSSLENFVYYMRAVADGADTAKTSMEGLKEIGKELYYQDMGYEYEDPLANLDEMVYTIPTEKSITISATDNASTVLKGVSNSIDPLPENKNITISATDNATKTIQGITNNINKTKNSTIEINPMLSKSSTAKFNSDMYSATENAGKESVKGFNKAWEINSPSKVAEDSGEFIGQGVINGIKRVYESPQTQETLNSLKESLPKINFEDLYNSDSMEFDLSPQQIINMNDGTLNLNTDNVGNDIMNGGFGDTMSRMGLNIGDASTSLADMNAYTQEANDALATEGGKFYDDTELIDEISGLREDVLTMADAMAKIKMYLDTNKLIGEMVVPMDQALAARATRAQRGN